MLYQKPLHIFHANQEIKNKLCIILSKIIAATWLSVNQQT